MIEESEVDKLKRQVEALQYIYDDYRKHAVRRVKELEKEVEFWKGQYKDATDDAEETERQLKELQDKK